MNDELSLSDSEIAATRIAIVQTVIGNLQAVSTYVTADPNGVTVEDLCVSLDAFVRGVKKG